MVSRFPSRGGLGPGLGSVSEAITSWAMLIHFSEDGGRLKAGLCLSINCIFTEVSQQSSSFSRDSNQKLTSFSKESNEVGLLSNCELPVNSTQGKGASAAWFRRLCWCKEDKAVTVRLKPVAMTVCIEVIVKLLGGLLGGLPFRGD